MPKSYAYSLLAFLLLVSAWMASTLPSTRFDYNFDKFFKPDDAATEYFEEHRKQFGTDNDFVLLGIVRESGIFDTAFYREINALSTDIESLELVTRVLSPTSIRIPIREPLTGALFERPILTGNPEKDSLYVYATPWLSGSFFSKERPALSILIETEQKLSKDKCDVLYWDLHALLEDYSFDSVHLAGRSIGQVVYIEKIQKEFALFLGIALLFVTILLFIMFGTLRGVVIPLITVLLAVVWSIGILNLSGAGISILLNMLPPVIFVVGMSDAVHLYARYLEELRKGHEKDYALRQMVRDTGLATLLTSITTSVGFASLYFTGIPALQEFGLLTAAGVLAAFVISIILMPAWLSLSGTPNKSLNKRFFNSWDGALSRAFPKIIAYRKPLLWGALALGFTFSLSATQLRQNNFLLEDLKPGEKLSRDFAFFDQSFSGVRPFELGIRSPSGKIALTDSTRLRALEDIEAYLKDKYGVRATNSVLDIYRGLVQSRNNGRPEAYRLPETAREWKQAHSDFDRLHRSGRSRLVLDSARVYARLFGRVGDLGARHFEANNEAFFSFISEQDYDGLFDLEVSGTGTLIDRTNQNLVGSLSRGLAAAFVLISLIMGFVFKSGRMLAIALIPNILPLLAVAAVMYYLGIDLKLSTSIIFTIAFGIAVDDTIHILSRYKLELLKGRPPYIALKDSFVHTGKALIVTSIILLGGFISLCFSSFQSTFYIGLLVSLTLLFALIFDLSILPALLYSLKAKSIGAKGDLPFAEKENQQNEQAQTQAVIEPKG